MKKNTFQGLIRAYQQFISPYYSRHCRFYPSCSEYSYRAIEKYGLARGLIKSIGRLLRCNPLSRGGADCP